MNLAQFGAELSKDISKGIISSKNEHRSSTNKNM